jgi:hypothetical protein
MGVWACRWWQHHLSPATLFLLDDDASSGCWDSQLKDMVWGQRIAYASIYTPRTETRGRNNPCDWILVPSRPASPWLTLSEFVFGSCTCVASACCMNRRKINYVSCIHHVCPDVVGDPRTIVAWVRSSNRAESDLLGADGVFSGVRLCSQPRWGGQTCCQGGPTSRRQTRVRATSESWTTGVKKCGRRRPTCWTTCKSH